MNEMIAAKKMSWKMVKLFPDIPLEDLELEAYTLLVEAKGDTDAGRYIIGDWNLYHYAIAYVTSMRECSGDAVDYIGVPDLTEVVDMKVDAEAALSIDAQFVLNNVLEGKLLDKKKGSKYKTLSMEVIKENLMNLGWSVYRSREVVKEIKFWWRSYGIA